MRPKRLVYDEKAGSLRSFKIVSSWDFNDTLWQPALA